MTLIEDVPRLKELEVNALPGTLYEYDYQKKIQDAAPAMLNVLGEFREGDADDLAWIIRNYGFTLRDHIEVLRRYQAMAERMEKKSNSDSSRLK